METFALLFVFTLIFALLCYNILKVCYTEEGRQLRNYVGLYFVVGLLAAGLFGYLLAVLKFY